MKFKEQIVSGVAGGVIATVVVSIVVYLWEEINSLVINDIPSGAVVAYIGREPTPHKNWEDCESMFSGRYLVGTEKLDEVKDTVGGLPHHHKVNIRTTGERDGRRDPGPEPQVEGADNYTGHGNWFHRHDVKGPTMGEKHIPPSIKVRFLCKK